MNGIKQLLQDRVGLARALAALDLKGALPALLAAHDRQVLSDRRTLAVLDQLLAKWMAGEKLAPEDLEGCPLDRISLLMLLAVLAVPRIRERHAELGLPASVTEETCRAIGGRLFEALREHPDRLLGKLSWAREYARGVMFKTGLFVCQLTTASLHLPVWAFRKKSGAQTVALAADGLAVNAGGLLCAEGEPEQFVTALEQISETITGHRITPAGRILAQRITLRRDAWDTVLSPGMMTAALHIPPERGMTADKCKASLQSAAGIIRSHLGSLGARCFTCISWILSPDWLEWLPESNMARFMREVHLFPVKSSPEAGILFVFHQRAAELDLRTAPRASRLQRFMLERLERKIPLHSGGMFLSLDDVDRFGTP